MIKKYCFLVIILCLGYSVILSQNADVKNPISKIDSLKATIYFASEDTNTVKKLNKLSALYRRESDFSNSIGYANKAQELSKKIKYFIGLYVSQRILSICYFEIGKQDSALFFMNQCYQYKEKINDETGMCESANLLGLIYGRKNDFVKSLKMYQKSLDLAKKLKSKKSELMALNNIAILYQAQGNDSKSVEYYNQSAKLAEVLDEPLLLSGVYAGIGNVYSQAHNWDKTMEYYNKAFEIRKKLGNKALIGRSYADLGFVFEKTNNLDKAIEMFNLSTAIFEEIGLTTELVTNYLNLGNIFVTKKDYLKAIDYYKKMLIYSKESEDLKRITESNLKLGLTYFEAKDYAAASRHLVLYSKMIEEVNDETASKQLVEMETKYETEKKENEIKFQNQQLMVQQTEISNQSLQKIIYASALIFVFVLAIFIFRSYKNQKRSSLIIIQQKQETEFQKSIIEQKNRDITDSINYAERIQRALLANKDLLNQNLNDYFILFKPKDVVSGDFYWASSLRNGNFSLVIADSTGHGVPGAIMSILNMACLKESVLEGLIHPDEILGRTRQLIIDSLRHDGSEEGGKDGMDCSFISFDFNNLKLTCSLANNPIWIIRDQTLTEIKPDRMPVGRHSSDKNPFTLHSFNLKRGDVVYGLTDGFVDQFGGKSGKKFMSKNLKELLLTNAHLPMPEQKNIFENAFKNWIGDLEQIDDVTLIGIRI